MTRINDIDTLARTIYGEAEGEPTLGKRAIASVVLNRYRRHTWFSGEDIAATCKFRVAGSKYYQFSCWNDGRRRDIIEAATDDRLGECLQIAKGYVDGELADVVAGCCHYHTITSHPYWSKGLRPDFIIVKHCFFKKVK